MTAFMQTQAPAHRYLLARRIARNFTTLGEQECFSADCRQRFSRLALRWQDNARLLAPGQPREECFNPLELARRALRRWI